MPTKLLTHFFSVDNSEKYRIEEQLKGHCFTNHYIMFINNSFPAEIILGM
jgi:hypothetical protein